MRSRVQRACHDHPPPGVWNSPDGGPTGFPQSTDLAAVGRRPSDTGDTCVRPLLPLGRKTAPQTLRGSRRPLTTLCSSPTVKGLSISIVRERKADKLSKTIPIGPAARPVRPRRFCNEPVRLPPSAATGSNAAPKPLRFERRVTRRHKAKLFSRPCHDRRSGNRPLTAVRL